MFPVALAAWPIACLDDGVPAALMRSGCRWSPRQVNMIKEDGTIIHFKAPKVQAAIAANTFCVSGTAEMKDIKSMMPGILNQLGPENMSLLQKVAQELGSQENSTLARCSAAFWHPDLPRRLSYLWRKLACSGRHDGRWRRSQHGFPG